MNCTAPILDVDIRGGIERRPKASRPGLAGRNPAARRRSAFTLVELMVVMGIMLVIIAMLLPAVQQAWKRSIRNRLSLDLQTVAIGLENFKADFNQYPARPAATGGGAAALFQALGGGYQVTPGQGKKYGPYISPDSLKNLNGCFVDKLGHPILYYAGKKGGNIYVKDSSTPAGGYPGGVTSFGGYLGPNGMFNPLDNDGVYDTRMPYPMTSAMFMVLMGDTNLDGFMTPGTTEIPAYTGNYVLWSAGPDEIYGPTGSMSGNQTLPAAPNNPCDDVANFPPKLTQGLKREDVKT